MYYGTEYVLQVVLLFNSLNANPQKWSKWICNCTILLWAKCYVVYDRKINSLKVHNLLGKQKFCFQKMTYFVSIISATEASSFSPASVNQVMFT